MEAQYRDLTNVVSKKTSALIMAGGRGSRLGPLTTRKSKPAVYFGGQYRIIDFVMSNCVHSGIKKIAIFTQYKAHSLIKHLVDDWSPLFRPNLKEFLDIIPASQMLDNEVWYRGTADCIAHNTDIIKNYDSEYFIVLAGDHIYKMDYAKMIADHVIKGAGCTVGCVTVKKEEGSEFGIMHIDSEHKIIDFLEKPSNPPTRPGSDDECLASMGIYVFDKNFLLDILQKDIINEESSHDFGKDVIPYCVKEGIAYAHLFDDSCVRNVEGDRVYWKDVGTIDAFYQANLDLTMPNPEINIFDKDWPIITNQRNLPPAKFLYNLKEDNRVGVAYDSLVSGGCIISGATIHGSVIFNEARVNSYCTIINSIIMPNCNIGRYCKIKNTIIDKNTKVPDNTIIGENIEEDRKRFHVTDSGIVIVNRKNFK